MMARVIRFFGGVYVATSSRVADEASAYTPLGSISQRSLTCHKIYITNQSTFCGTKKDLACPESVHFWVFLLPCVFLLCIFEWVSFVMYFRAECNQIQNRPRHTAKSRLNCLNYKLLNIYPKANEGNQILRTAPDCNYYY